MAEATIAGTGSMAGDRPQKRPRAGRPKVEEMVVAVASGKGGTGKTTIAVNLALTVAPHADVQFVDCDVEEPNAHLFLHPIIESSEEVTLPVPSIDPARCTACGKCGRACMFHAIVALGDQVMTFPELCHGCGGCSRACPTGAITEKPTQVGSVEIGRAGGVRFVGGRLEVGHPLAPPVVRAARLRAGTLRASDRDCRLTLIDAPPGTSCPVVASVKGSDFCVLVTEPTPFGLNDLVLAVGMLRKLGVPFGAVINRSGMGNRDVAAYCENEGIPVMLEIPFSRDYAACYARGGRLAEEFPELREALWRLWLSIRRRTLRSCWS